MELKATLQKPYTFEQKRDFILTQNRQNGYEIREKSLSLEAWGYTDEEKQAQRQVKFETEFFNTSLGWVRRNVTMQNGSKKDFLSDLLPTISMGISSGQEVKIITYDQPSFDEDVEDWTEYQNFVNVTPQFIQECFRQLSDDFLPINEEENNAE